jgi:hypothetical protein
VSAEPPAAVKYDAPHAAPPHLPAAEFFAYQDAADIDDRDSAGSGEQFPEPLYDDSDDAPVITAPLQPPPRPAPTILHPTPASRAAPPPERHPGSGFWASVVAQAKAPPPEARDVPRPAPARPVFQPPARRVFQPPAPKVEAKPAALESRPMTSIKEVSWDHRFGTTPDVPVHKVKVPAPGWQERARPFIKPVPRPTTGRKPAVPTLTADDIPFD